VGKNPISSIGARRNGIGCSEGENREQGVTL